MNALLRISGALLALTLAGSLTACEAGSDAPEGSATTAAADAAPPTFPSEVGATIAADQVEAASDSGLFVYVNPEGDGTGIIVRADAPYPQEFTDGIYHSRQRYVLPAGITPSEETLALEAHGVVRNKYSEAVFATGVPLGTIAPYICFGEFTDPDNLPEGREMDFDNEEAMAEARWDYRLCTEPSWVVGVQNVEGYREFNKSMTTGYLDLELARAALQPMVEANPTMQIVVVPEPGQ